jgi:hypothetical protein
LLVGGRGPIDFRLRVAQAHARHDLSPSHWSHVALVAPRAGAASEAEVIEVSLDPAGGFGFPVPTNAIQVGKLERYRDPKSYPNIALVQIACPWEKLEENLARLRLRGERAGPATRCSTAAASPRP